MSRRVVGFLAVLLGVVSLSAAPKPRFEVKFSDLTSDLRVCSVVFIGEKPAGGVVDKILRSSLESAVLLDPNSDILASAYHESEVLSTKEYSGALRYRARDKRIVSAEAEPEAPRSTYDVGPYFVEVTEEKTSPDLKPERRWLTLAIVFAEVPQRTLAYASIVTEVRKLAPRGQEIIAYAMQGNKYNRSSWQQIKDTDGGYLFARYDTSSGEVGRYNATSRAVEFFDKLTPMNVPRVSSEVRVTEAPATPATTNAALSSVVVPTANGSNVPGVAKAGARSSVDAKQQQLDKRVTESQAKRASEGSATAQYDLALKYYRGDGVEKNEVEAKRLFRLAADQGHPGAVRMLELLK